MKAPVTLIFFNRPETLEKVFEQVRAAKPPKLFLVQDGAREGNQRDAEKIQECRAVVSNVDWDCQVYTNYSDVNLGCGVRPQSGISWVLSQEESTIILEDDCVPDPTFFDYCDEMLERYKDDERICYISGLNHFEEWDFGGSSYGFTKGGAIWGWATWRRAWAKYDYSVSGIKDPYVEKNMYSALSLTGDQARIKRWKTANELVGENTKLSYWDVQWGFVKFAYNQLVIVPRVNLISNIGVGADSTHALGANETHKRYRDYNNMPVKALEFPLAHPEHMLCDMNYDRLLLKCNKKMYSKWNVLKYKVKKMFKQG